MNYNTFLQELFKAYYDCRKNKRKTINQLQFEIDYESNLIKLADEIYNGNYEVGKSIAFIVDKPVKREIFAGDFRDRVVHHYVINQINHIFENLFIHDSYSCREGKGTSFGIKRVNKFIRSCSKKYTEDCYIMKLDIQGFFMSIDKDILWEKIEKVLNCSHYPAGLGNPKSVIFGLDPNIQKNQTVIVGLDPTIQKREINRLTGSSCQARGGQDKGARGGQDKIEFNKFILFLIQKIIFNDPTKNCIIKGDKTNWQGLPKSKSLFFARKNTGLPIGNLTSQIFANLYLDSFDKFIKHKLKIKYYGRYVDDFILTHADKNYLLYCKNEIEKYLKQELKLQLHPNKFYLQYYTKGVLFLGAFIKPYILYSGKRTKGNFYEKIQKLNYEVKMKYSCHYLAGPNNPENLNQLTRSPCQARGGQIFKNKFLSIINSYLGFLKHYKSYAIRKKILLQKVCACFWNNFYISGGYTKVVRKKK